jgi:N-acetylglucosamine-6-phosphate deacetylase
MKEIAAFHLSHGTCTMLATTLTAPMYETKAALSEFARYQCEVKNGVLAGVFLEGPWLNPHQCGAQDVGNMLSPSEDLLRELKREYPFILRVAAAPELDEGYAFSKAGKELGILVSAAHTDANFAQIEEAKNYGYSLMTHLYSGMKGTERKNAYRVAGAVEAGLYFEDLYAEIIADGKHLPLELLRFIYKCKGADRLCLITDGTRASGLKNGASALLGSKKNGIPVVIEDDVAKLPDRQSFAGSTATADRLYKTMAKAIGKDMVALSKLSSTTPARIMGWTDRGEIATGKRADLLLVNENLDIEKIITEKEY